MELTVPQFRTIQANFALLVSGHQRDLSTINKSLNSLVNPPEGIDFSRAINTRWNSSFGASGLLFRFRQEEIFTAHLILHDNRHPAPQLHVEHSSKEILPTLVSLHYYHKAQDTIKTGQYLWAGAIQVVSDPDFEYIRVKADSPFLKLAGPFYILNLPIEHLPYPEGRKLALLNPLKEIGITCIGELIQREPEELEGKLGKSGLMILRGILQGWGLSLGTHLPNWRPPQ